MIVQEAATLAALLGERSQRIVFAESCTAGLAGALLAAVPGISRFLCGSAVTYQEACKEAWLGVPHGLLLAHTAVSAEVTAAMAVGVLERTAAADFSAAITGHLGPLAPTDVDGVCFLAIAWRSSGACRIRRTQRLVLDASERVARQHEAARKLLALLSLLLTHG